MDYRMKLFAAVLAASLVVAAADANAFYYSVYVLKSPAQPEHKLCADIQTNTPQQALQLCLARFGVKLGVYVKVDNFCRPYRSVWRTVHRDGTTPQWGYDARTLPPYPNGC
jgi:DMSO reductase anchor subunit